MDLSMFESIADGLDHPEGVALGSDGQIYAGGEAGQIYVVEDDCTAREIASTGGFLYGVTLDGDANVYGCDFGRAEVVRVTPAGEITSYSSGTADSPMRVPNFAAFDDAGALYVTDSGEWGAGDGCIFKITPGGATEVWTETVSRFPNGCCLTADGDALLVAESGGRRIARISIRDDGTAGDVETVADLTGSQPDGIALAADGTMFVGCYRPDLIWRIEPDGRAEAFAEDPDGVVLNQPANVAFIGPGLDRIVVSSLGGWSLMAADAGATGLPLRYPRI